MTQYTRKVFIGEQEALNADEAMWNKIIPKYGLDSWAIMKYDINDLAVRLPIEEAKHLATGTGLAKDLNDISGAVQKEGGGSEPATGPGPGESVTNATKAIANGSVKVMEHEAGALAQPDAAHSKPAKPAPSEARPMPSTQKPCGAFQKTGGCAGPAANVTSGWSGGP